MQAVQDLRKDVEGVIMNRDEVLANIEMNDDINLGGTERSIACDAWTAGYLSALRMVVRDLEKYDKPSDVCQYARQCREIWKKKIVEIAGTPNE